MAFTVLAEGGWLRWDISVNDLGTETVDFSDAGIMCLRIVRSNEGVNTYCMELPAGKRYYFRNGILSNGKIFHRVTDAYEIELLDAKSFTGTFEKNGYKYQVSVNYVLQDDEIVTGTLVTYPVEEGEVLLNAFCAPNNNWPVYVNLDTGEIRDALPSFTVDDFQGHVGYVQRFRGGLLVSGLSKDSSRNHLYWIGEPFSDAKELVLPEKYYTADGDYLYSYNRVSKIHYLDADWEFRKLESNFNTRDDPDYGLFAIRQQDGSLGIIDVINQTTYSVPEIKVQTQDLDYRGINASRHSTDGMIVLTSIKYDWEKSAEFMNYIGFLDTESGTIQFLNIMSEYGLISFGWMDDSRYAVIYEDEMKQYLYIYEMN